MIDNAPENAARIADLLGPEDLQPWQRKWLDELLDSAHKDEHLEYRFVGRKVGYAWVWVPNAD